MNVPSNLLDEVRALRESATIPAFRRGKLEELNQSNTLQHVKRMHQQQITDDAEPLVPDLNQSATKGDSSSCRALSSLEQKRLAASAINKDRSILLRGLSSSPVTPSSLATRNVLGMGMPLNPTSSTLRQRAATPNILSSAGNAQGASNNNDDNNTHRFLPPLASSPSPAPSSSSFSSPASARGGVMPKTPGGGLRPPLPSTTAASRSKSTNNPTSTVTSRRGNERIARTSSNTNTAAEDEEANGPVSLSGVEASATTMLYGVDASEECKQRVKDKHDAIFDASRLRVLRHRRENAMSELNAVLQAVFKHYNPSVPHRSGGAANGGMVTGEGTSSLNTSTENKTNEKEGNANNDAKGASAAGLLAERRKMSISSSRAAEKMMGRWRQIADHTAEQTKGAPDPEELIAMVRRPPSSALESQEQRLAKVKAKIAIGRTSSSVLVPTLDELMLIMGDERLEYLTNDTRSSARGGAGGEGVSSPPMLLGQKGNSSNKKEVGVVGSPYASRGLQSQQQQQKANSNINATNSQKRAEMMAKDAQINREVFEAEARDAQEEEDRRKGIFFGGSSKSSGGGRGADEVGRAANDDLSFQHSMALQVQWLVEELGKARERADIGDERYRLIIREMAVTEQQCLKLQAQLDDTSEQLRVTSDVLFSDRRDAAAIRQSLDVQLKEVRGQLKASLAESETIIKREKESARKLSDASAVLSKLKQNLVSIQTEVQFHALKSKSAAEEKAAAVEALKKLKKSYEDVKDKLERAERAAEINLMENERKKSRGDQHNDGRHPIVGRLGEKEDVDDESVSDGDDTYGSYESDEEESTDSSSFSSSSYDSDASEIENDIDIESKTINTMATTDVPTRHAPSDAATRPPSLNASGTGRNTTAHGKKEAREEENDAARASNSAKVPEASATETSFLGYDGGEQPSSTTTTAANILSPVEANKDREQKEEVRGKHFGGQAIPPTQSDTNNAENTALSFLAGAARKNLVKGGARNSQQQQEHPQEGQHTFKNSQPVHSEVTPGNMAKKKSNASSKRDLLAQPQRAKSTLSSRTDSTIAGNSERRKKKPSQGKKKKKRGNEKNDTEEGPTEQHTAEALDDLVALCEAFEHGEEINIDDSASSSSEVEEKVDDKKKKGKKGEENDEVGVKSPLSTSQQTKKKKSKRTLKSKTSSTVSPSGSTRPEKEAALSLPRTHAGDRKDAYNASDYGNRENDNHNGNNENNNSPSKWWETLTSRADQQHGDGGPLAHPQPPMLPRVSFGDGSDLAKMTEAISKLEADRQKFALLFLQAQSKAEESERNAKMVQSAHGVLEREKSELLMELDDLRRVAEATSAAAEAEALAMTEMVQVHHAQSASEITALQNSLEMAINDGTAYRRRCLALQDQLRKAAHSITVMHNTVLSAPSLQALLVDSASCVDINTASETVKQVAVLSQKVRELVEEFSGSINAGSRVGSANSGGERGIGRVSSSNSNNGFVSVSKSNNNNYSNRSRPSSSKAQPLLPPRPGSGGGSNLNTSSSHFAFNADAMLDQLEQQKKIMDKMALHKGQGKNSDDNDDDNNNNTEASNSDATASSSMYINPLKRMAVGSGENKKINENANDLVRDEDRGDDDEGEEESGIHKQMSDEKSGRRESNAEGVKENSDNTGNDGDRGPRRTSSSLAAVTPIPRRRSSSTSGTSGIEATKREDTEVVWGSSGGSKNNNTNTNDGGPLTRMSPPIDSLQKGVTVDATRKNTLAFSPSARAIVATTVEIAIQCELLEPPTLSPQAQTLAPRNAAAALGGKPTSTNVDVAQKKKEKEEGEVKNSMTTSNEDKDGDKGARVGEKSVIKQEKQTEKNVTEDTNKNLDRGDAASTPISGSNTNKKATEATAKNNTAKSTLSMVSATTAATTTPNSKKTSTSVRANPTIKSATDKPSTSKTTTTPFPAASKAKSSTRANATQNVKKTGGGDVNAVDGNTANNRRRTSSLISSGGEHGNSAEKKKGEEEEKDEDAEKKEIEVIADAFEEGYDESDVELSTSTTDRRTTRKKNDTTGGNYYNPTTTTSSSITSTPVTVALSPIVIDPNTTTPIDIKAVEAERENKEKAAAHLKKLEAFVVELKKRLEIAGAQIRKEQGVAERLRHETNERLEDLRVQQEAMQMQVSQALFDKQELTLLLEEATKKIQTLQETESRDWILDKNRRFLESAERAIKQLQSAVNATTCSECLDPVRIPVVLYPCSHIVCEKCFLIAQHREGVQTPPEIEAAIRLAVEYQSKVDASATKSLASVAGSAVPPLTAFMSKHSKYYSPCLETTTTTTIAVGRGGGGGREGVAGSLRNSSSTGTRGGGIATMNYRNPAPPSPSASLLPALTGNPPTLPLSPIGGGQVSTAIGTTSTAATTKTIVKTHLFFCPECNDRSGRFVGHIKRVDEITHKITSVQRALEEIQTSMKLVVTAEDSMLNRTQQAPSAAAEGEGQKGDASRIAHRYEGNRQSALSMAGGNSSINVLHNGPLSLDNDMDLGGMRGGGGGGGGGNARMSGGFDGHYAAFSKTIDLSVVRIGDTSGLNRPPFTSVDLTLPITHSDEEDE